MMDISKHQLIHINDDGDVVIGCHTCGWSEKGNGEGRAAKRRHEREAVRMEKELTTVGVAW